MGQEGAAAGVALSARCRSKANVRLTLDPNLRMVRPSVMRTQPKQACFQVQEHPQTPFSSRLGMTVEYMAGPISTLLLTPTDVVCSRVHFCGAGL